MLAHFIIQYQKTKLINIIMMLPSVTKTFSKLLVGLNFISNKYCPLFLLKLQVYFVHVQIVFHLISNTQKRITTAFQSFFKGKSGASWEKPVVGSSVQSHTCFSWRQPSYLAVLQKSFCSCSVSPSRTLKACAQVLRFNVTHFSASSKDILRWNWLKKKKGA